MARGGFDEVLKILGHGKWNLLYYFGLGLCGFMIPCFVFAGSFIAPSLAYECDLTHEKGTVNVINQCKYSVAQNYTDEEGEDEIKTCSSWSYNSTNFEDTLTTEFNMVCDLAYLRPVYQTVYNMGNFIGAPLNGILADRYGRRILLIISSIVGVGSVLVGTVASNFTVILICRFVTGLTSYPLLQTGYSLSMEVCEPKLRTSVGILLSLPWAFGTMWWGALGFMIKDWRWLIRATTIPAIFYFVILRLMDESPRWLIVKGYHRRALKALKKAARWNHSTLPPDEDLLKRMMAIQRTSKSENETDDEMRIPPMISSRMKGGLKQVFILYKTPELRKRTFLMYTVFLVSATVFYGLTLNAVNFKLDPFMYMVVGGLTEIPAYTITVPIVAKLGRVPPTSAFYFICGLTILTLAFIPSGGLTEIPAYTITVPIVAKLGRVPPTSAFYFICGLTILTLAVIPSDPKWLLITLVMVGKFSISSAYQIIYLVATEIFPTEVRMQGLGTSAFVATLGSVTAPFITDLVGNEYPWVPSLIFGGLSLIAGVASIFIPETLNKHLPETVQELEREATLHNSGQPKDEECGLTGGCSISYRYSIS